MGTQQLERAIFGLWPKGHIESVGIRILNGKVYYSFVGPKPLMATNLYTCVISKENYAVI